MQKLKSGAKMLLGTVGRLPVLGVLLRQPFLRRRLSRIAMAEYLYVGTFRRHPFDRLNGINTSGSELPRDFPDDEKTRAQSNAYLGSQPNVIRLALAQLPPVDTFTFVDLGCGKGRPLFVATGFPFHQIVGVELSPQLAAIARSNAAIMAARYPERTRVRIAVSDAGTFALPAGNLVVFLYHPFGPEVMARVVERLEAALRAENRVIYVVYYNPVAGRCFDGSASFRRCFAGMLPYAPEERGYGLDLLEDPVAIWQAGNVLAPTSSAKRKIVVCSDGMGVEFVD